MSTPHSVDPEMTRFKVGDKVRVSLNGSEGVVHSVMARSKRPIEVLVGEGFGSYLHRYTADELTPLPSAPSPEEAMKREWVSCPICHEPDMQCETDRDGNSLIFCTNHACKSNVPTPLVPESASPEEARPMPGEQTRIARHPNGHLVVEHLPPFVPTAEQTDKAFASLSKAWPILAKHADHIDGEFDLALTDMRRYVAAFREQIAALTTAFASDSRVVSPSAGGPQQVEAWGVEQHGHVVRAHAEKHDAVHAAWEINGKGDVVSLYRAPSAGARMGGFDLDAFSYENRARCESPSGFNHALNSWSLSDWFTAALGELGEAANVAKKLNRVRDGIRGNKETTDALRAKLAAEVADTFIYLDLLAQSQGLRLSEIVRRTFDAKSAEIGYGPSQPSTDTESR